MARAGRPRKFDRNAAIQAAIPLFWQKGYHDTSIADLKAAMGGISSASFYAAFKSKEALFEEALKLYCNTCGDVISCFQQARLPAIQRLRLGLEQSAQMQTNHTDHPQGCLTVLCLPTCSDAYQGIYDKIATTRDAVKTAIHDCIASGIAADEFRKSLDPTGATIMITAFLQGLSIQAKDGCSQQDLQKAIDQLIAGLT